MKKILMSSLMVLVSACMFAATHTWTNVLEIKLTDGNNDTYTSRFGEASDLSNTALWSPSAATFEGATVKAYVEYQGVNYEKLYLNDFADNTPLIVKTYNSDQLTFNLKALYGTVTLHDNADGTDYTVDAAGTATLSQTFTVATNATIADRFVIFYVPAPSYVTTVTTNAYGLATFSYDSDLEAVESGVKLYKGDLNGNELVLSEVDYVKANQGVIVYGAADTTYHFNVGTGTSDFTGNELLPASAWDYAAQDGYSIYVLSGNMLYLYEGDTMKPNKAFLKVNQNPISGNAPARISMRFNGTQDVENAEAEDAKAVKFVENGEIFIRRGEAVYNMQGQIVK